MARLFLLDSGPFGLIVRAPSKPQVVRCLTWLKAISAAGATVIIPEIAHYEVRRELIRIRAVGSLRRLDHALDPSSGLRHLTLTTDAMIRAAEFWAFLRQMGIPTASPDALDADAIERVRDEARPQPRDADELHDVLLGLVAAPLEDAWRPFFETLLRSGRASCAAGSAPWRIRRI